MAKIAAIFQLLDKKVTVSSHRLELLSPARDAAIAREAILHGADRFLRLLFSFAN
ncbi:TPA: hypothetical protein ACNTCI_003643 [Escherichia coli]